MTRPGPPHDRADLYLAPVALSIDWWLERWSRMPEDDVVVEVLMSTNRQPRGRAEREAAVLAAMQHEVNSHGWELTLVERGVRLAHQGHALVLGLPAVLRDYIDG